MQEDEQSRLTLTGDLGPMGGPLLALALGGLAWWLYWRETRRAVGVARWLLPSLRAAAVVLVVLILTAPVLRHERTIRQLGRVSVLVDASRSMQLKDAEMPVARKVALLAGQDQLGDDGLVASARAADDRLREAGDMLDELLAPGAEAESPEPQEALAAFAQRLEGARPGFFRVLRAGYEDEAGRKSERISGEFLAGLMQPARDLAERAGEINGRQERQAVLAGARRLTEPLVLARRELELAVTAYVERRRSESDGVEADGRTALLAALDEFDRRTRWQRLERLLLDDERGLMERLRETQEVELIALAGERTEILWRPGAAGVTRADELPRELGAEPMAGRTNLAEPLIQALDGDLENRALILLSDGQHNSDGGPAEMARRLGELGVPVFAIGMGSSEPPRDLAIRRVISPDGVYVEDQVRGEILIEDRMTAGGAYEVRIESGDQLVWEDFLQADGGGEKRLEFAFPLDQLVVAEEGRVEDGIRRRNLPLDFRVVARQVGEQEIDAARREVILDNNERRFRVQALTRKRRLLLLDGRPRWESRYLKNLFDRDERWEVNPLVRTLDPANGIVWERGDGEGQFPASRDELFAYDLIVFGDVPGGALTGEEGAWLADFVGERGGGLIFIDGRNQFVMDPAHEGLAALLPVERIESDGLDLPQGLELTSEGRELMALRIDDRAAANRGIWGSLPPPRWAAPVRALPDATTLVEVFYEGEDGSRRAIDAMVWRRYGAGRVFYSAIDELWRWRYDVADRYYEAFWVQISNWIGEAPFAVEGPRLAIGTNRLAYDAGDRAEVRVRLQDEDGRQRQQEGLRAEFLRDGEEVAEIGLEPDENGGGIHRGQTGKLPAGDYELRVVGADGTGFGASMAFRVNELPDLEMEELSMNQGLLRSIAGNSGGGFLLEEHAGEVLDRLENFDRRETIVRDTVLWSSYWWFVPIILLLTVEWLVRKSVGMV